MVQMVPAHLSNVDERASPCAGCGDQNIIDYAINTYGIGMKTSGVTSDLGNGNWSDPLDSEYRNWPNIFKLNWPSRPWLASTASTNSYQICCNDPKEIYWAVLNSLDKHISQLHFPVEHIAQATDGGAEARRLFSRYAGRSIDDTPDVWIVFRERRVITTRTDKTARREPTRPCALLSGLAQLRMVLLSAQSPTQSGG